MKNGSVSKQGLIYKYMDNLSMMKKEKFELNSALFSALLYVPSKQIHKWIELSWKQLEKENEHTNV